MTDPADIVPDGFDLEAAKNRPSSTPDDERRCCPDCGSRSITRKVGNELGSRAQPGNYRCAECGAHFDQPTVVADFDHNGRELATDGGRRVEPAPIENEARHSRDTRRGRLVIRLAEYPLAEYAFGVWMLASIAGGLGLWKLGELTGTYVDAWVVLVGAIGWILSMAYAGTVEVVARGKRCPRCDYQQDYVNRFCPSCGHGFDPLEIGTDALDADALTDTHPNAEAGGDD